MLLLKHGQAEAISAAPVTTDTAEQAGGKNQGPQAY